MVLELTLKVARAALPMFRRYLEHLAFGAEWVPQHVDAYTLYQTHLNYGKIPDRPALAHGADAP
ncbi:MAG: hypothetical protein M3Z41_10600 [Candidatus Eremiobacteraeota bacterium]|nr:hypothetical protein [Candidatus Eremiobacteraeota bacterium]